MNKLTKSLIVILCSLAFEKTTITSFLFHDGAQARSAVLYEWQELLNLDARALPVDTALIFADPYSPHPSDARIVTISPNEAGNKWIVASIVVQNPSPKIFNTLQDAQDYALMNLYQPEAPAERILPKKSPRNKNPQAWRRT